MLYSKCFSTIIIVATVNFNLKLFSFCFLYTNQYKLSRIGRLAIRHTHKHHTLLVGARDDLEKVTEMAYRQVAEFGMNPVIGHISLPPQAGGKRSYSQKLSRMIDEVRGWVSQHVYMRIVL